MRFVETFMVRETGTLGVSPKIEAKPVSKACLKMYADYMHFVVYSNYMAHTTLLGLKYILGSELYDSHRGATGPQLYWDVCVEK